ncbi:hypothetical protein K4A83_03545 [Spirulina subsalsa FACHB-351]|uniref:Uncharacterized protein n=1 Tax=Spirulina subsalsa FACHB-351 TaxID=234711 RepID=A0ABT3L2N4_9CYAN|nr:hypothetical protein [Spirulina subsalsa]MCW6035349.1 hypothetical protein [Spirulina subsalsa FACHB-351]
MSEPQKNPTLATLPETVERILSTGYLTRQEHFQLVTLFLSDLAVNEEERRQLNRIFDELQMGRLKYSSST